MTCEWKGIIIVGERGVLQLQKYSLKAVFLAYRSDPPKDKHSHAIAGETFYIMEAFFLTGEMRVE